MKRDLSLLPSLASLASVFLLFSCSHSNLKRELADPSLDGLRHESLARYTAKDLKNFNGLSKNIALCHEKRYDEAFSKFKETLDQNQNNPLYWNRLGTCYYLKGEFPKALVYLEIAMNLTKDKSLLASIHNNAGLVHLKQNNFFEAAASFKAAIKKDAKSRTPKYNLAMVYLAKGLYSKARAILLKLRKANPRDVDFNYGLGHVYLMQKDYAKAIWHFKQIKGRHANRDDVATNLAAAYYLMGREKLALKTLEEAPMKVDRFIAAQTELKKKIEKKLEK